MPETGSIVTHVKTRGHLWRCSACLHKPIEPDLVFNDVVMAKKRGMELVGEIREVNPRIKVIFVSGFFGIKRLKRELDEEILKYGYLTLSKPFKISMMLDLVKDYLKETPNDSGRVNIFA